MISARCTCCDLTITAESWLDWRWELVKAHGSNNAIFVLADVRADLALRKAAK